MTLPALERLSALAEFAHRLCLMPAGSHFEPQNLVRVYRSELHRQGLTRGEGLQLQIVGDQFASFVEPLRKFAELEALPSDSEKAAAQVARLVREPRSGTHPLRHLALIAWLFGTWDAFSESYERETTNYLATNIGECQARSDPDADNLRYARLVELLRAGQCSASSAAKQVGVTTTTAIAWAAKAGLETDRRPKVLKVALRAKTVAVLRLGTDKQKVADQYSISLQLVTRLLRSESDCRTRGGPPESHELRTRRAALS